MAFVPAIPITNPTSFHPTTISPNARCPVALKRQSKRRCAVHATATEETDISKPIAATTNLAPPPATFFQAISQAQDAVDAALADGNRLLEVEFPPLPTAVLESSSVSSYDVSDANVRLAVDFAKKYAESGKRVALAFPDLVEKDRAVEQNGEKEEPIENIRFSSLRDARKGSFLERIWTTPEIDVAVRDNDDVFVVLGATCQELPDVERLVEAAGDRLVIFFNLKLDGARGDLGLPAFPRKSMHYRFLSKILPVYYLRTRTYSRSIQKSPFIVNYSGALYRVYPGAYQVLLDTSGGNYRRLCALDERPPLGQVRDILTDGMNLDGGKTEGDFMFKGYKSTTWWEDDRTEAESNKWRS